MHDYQRSFIELALKTEVLKFGEFTLKSGRKSPYFFNTGLFNTGRQMAEFGRHFAASIKQSEQNFDVLFGPAYKGITLSCAAAMSMADQYNEEIAFAYNRKEVKNHGEGGSMIGAPLKGKVAIIDDVITAGTAIREAIELIRAAGAAVECVFIAMDRQEVGQDQETRKSAIQEVESEFGIPVVAIATLDNLIDYLLENDESKLVKRMTDYRSRYGIS